MKRPQVAHRKEGLSVIELLVAIALVAILIALSLGGVSKITAHSRTTKCVYNLRATGTAALNYFTDRNGLFFESKTWYCYPSWGPNGWVGMRDYLGETSENLDASLTEFHHDSIITCPEIKRMHSKAFPGFLNMGFGMNIYLIALDPHPAYSWPDRPKQAGSPGRIQNVPKLSAMWMFTDIAGSRVGRGGGFFSDVSPNSESYLYFPHNGRQNIVFMDGHVESLTLQKFANPASKREFWGNLDEE